MANDKVVTSIRLERSLRDKAKIKAIQEGKQLSEYIVELIRKDIEQGK